MSRINRPETAFASTPKRKAKKEGDYLAFLHQLPCVVTKTNYGIQAAHVSFANTSYGHYGRGKGTKSPDRWAIPLCEEQHRLQHSQSEAGYWRNRGLDPHFIALVLWGLWTEAGDDAVEECRAIIMAGDYRL